MNSLINIQAEAVMSDGVIKAHRLSKKVKPEVVVRITRVMSYKNRVLNP